MLWLKRWLAFALRLVLIVVGLGLISGFAQSLQFVKDLEAAINHSRRAVLWSVGTFFGLSFAAFMGGVIYGVATSGGGGFSIEMSFREIKEAGRAGAWRTDPGWRFVAYMIVAGVALFIGLLSFIFVVGDVTAKLITAGMFVYALVRTAWAFAHA